MPGLHALITWVPSVFAYIFAPWLVPAPPDTISLIKCNA